jgi:predicted ferric reductase
MRKIILEGSMSIILLLSGVILLLTHLSTLTEKSNTIPAISILLLFLGGLILLLLTIRSIMKYVSIHQQEETAVETIVVGPNSLIQRNNDIVNDWDKTNEARDRLKLLKMASGSEEE